MPAIIEGPPEPGARRPPVLHRVAWFALLATGGALAAAATAYALRALLGLH